MLTEEQLLKRDGQIAKAKRWEFVKVKTVKGGKKLYFDQSVEIFIGGRKILLDDNNSIFINAVQDHVNFLIDKVGIDASQAEQRLAMYDKNSFTHVAVGVLGE